jgi:hypothetical protein
MNKQQRHNLINTYETIKAETTAKLTQWEILEILDDL